MPKIAQIQDSFTGGEFSPSVQGRKTFDKYSSALRRQENYQTGDKGQLVRRMGLRSVASTKNDGEAILVPFVFNTDQTYVLEFGDSYIRFYKEEDQLESSGSPYEISSPYTTSEFDLLWYHQINDVVYITHPDITTRKLSRTGDTAWALTEVNFIDGPYLPKNTTETTITITGSSPNFTLTASAVTGINNDAGFASPGDVGRLIRVEDDSGTEYKVYKITSVTSTTVVVGTLQYESDSASISGAKEFWRLGAFCPRLGYASHCVVHDSRLFLLGNSRIHGSIINDLENFSPTDIDDFTEVLDESAINRPLNDQNPIRWCFDGPTLQIGTSSTEYQLKPASISSPLTPTNNTAERQNTNVGGANIKPVNAGSTIFVQRSKRKVHDFSYSIADESFISRNISILSDHILKDGNGVKGLAYCREPNSIFYGYTEAGTWFAGTYIRDQQMVNMYKFPLEQGLKIISLTSIPSPDGSHDQLWAIVEYVADGNTIRRVCFMEEDFYPSSATDKSRFHFMDLMTTLTGHTSTTVTGADYLEGMEVAVVVDGVAQGNKTVASGEFELDFVDADDGSTVHYGIPYFPVIELLSQEGGNPFGTAHGKKRKIEHIGFNMLHSIGISVGESEDALDIKEFRNNAPPDTGEESPNLFTGETEKYKVNSGYKRLPTIIVKQTQPYPSTILDVYLDVYVSEK